MTESATSVVYENTIHETLGVLALEVGPDRVVLEMEIGPPVHQPMGLLHGGASAVLAESAASMGALANCDLTKEFVVGTDLNISHLRARSTGTLRATALPVRKGRTMHVWNIDLTDQDEVAVAVARCTLAIRPIRKADG